MNIVILAGGKGSLQLQQGIKEFFNSVSNINVDVLINAFDDGLSTGLVRKVYDGKILGPSDLRKNQTLRHEHLYGNTSLLDFLNIRCTMPVEDLQEYICSEIDKLHNVSYSNILYNGVRAYFNNPKHADIEYNDFSISNIIYAGLAGDDDYSLSAAGDLMAQALSIKNNVVIANDESLFLRAYTKYGNHLIKDEYNIDVWDDKSDPIDRIFLVDHLGNEKIPVLNEKSINLLKNADIIISSSGTQWTSIIPTYIFEGFREAYESSTAKKYLIMNRSQDKDMTGQSADDILNIVSRYISLDKTTVLIDTNADKTMDSVESSYNTIYNDLSGSTGKHDPIKLVKCLFKDYYSAYLNSDTYVFDYDDTIVARNNKSGELSRDNLDMINELSNCVKVCIATGNSIERVKLNSRIIDVYADGGNSFYIDKYFIKHLDKSLVFDQAEIDHVKSILEKHSLDLNFENRNYTMVSISPFNSHRDSIVSLLSSLYPQYKVKTSGRTTIDIIKLSSTSINDKSVVVNDISSHNIVYLGDECLKGNDFPFINEARNKSKLTGYIEIKDVVETNMFLKVLLSHLKD